MPSFDIAVCKTCGGRIRQWHDAPGLWFHDTVSADGEPFDMIDWHGHPDRQHWGDPT